MSLKIGCIYVGYQCEDLLARSLTPLTAARATKLGGHTWTICAVSVPFVGFDHGGASLDATRDLLRDTLTEGYIDCLIADEPPVPLKETEARGQALQWLVAQGCDTLLQWDADEIATELDLLRITSYVELNPWTPWFRLSLRNAVFTADQYLIEPFTPPRIHRVTAGGYTVTAFWDDNNVLYRNIKCPDHLKRDIDLASMTVPKEISWIRHESWLSNARSKAKIRYQLDARLWPECSFRWDEETDQLRFNEAYYAARGLSLPEVARE
jgi:hypothetical protein